ncbi:accessory gland protein Acp29AB-like [Drosophila eugracilis]|uniref:accessory gland protein Acp29AB-like n=1 Tax=Drosophila eugracilis TaxID=29029 RepID=UPI001BDA770D|nr:accessory gland protein Acp29AB-like [Drosophila eugracilis]
MYKFTVIFLWAFLALDLQGSLTGAQDGRRYVCLLTDPPNQCSEYCLSAMQPWINNPSNGLQDWDACDVKLSENQETLDRIEGQLTATKIEMEGQLTSLQVNLTKTIPLDLGERLDRIEGNQRDIESQLKAAQLNLECQLTSIKENLSQIDRKIQLQRYQRIGSRYFYIEHNHRATWENAELMCNEIGGHLASFKNQEEYKVIADQLSPRTLYWTGINDLAQQGKFISKASGKPATYLKWLADEPNYCKYNFDDNHCVEIHGNVKEMIVNSCSQVALYYICQADDEV